MIFHEVVEPSGDARGYYKGFHAAVNASVPGDCILKATDGGELLAEWAVNHDGTLTLVGKRKKGVR